MEKATRQKSKSSIKNGSANPNPVHSAGPNKASSRGSRAPGKRPSGGSYGGAKLSSDNCLEEIKNTFETTATNEERDLGTQCNDQALSGDEEEDTTQQSPAKTIKKKSNQKLVLCTFATRYNVIKRVVRKMDFKLNEDVNYDWDLYWSDTGVQPE